MAQSRATGCCKEKAVVAVRFSALGDVAMSLPVIYNAALANPEVRFVFVTRKPFATMALNMPENLTVIGVDLKNDYKGFFGMWRLFRMLKSQFSMSVMLDLHDVLRTKILRTLCRLSGVKVCTIDKGRQQKSLITRQHNKRLTKLNSMIDRYTDVVSSAGLKTDGGFSGLFDGKPADSSLISPVTKPKSSPDERWIGIAPFAKHKGKIYPSDKMESVVAALSSSRKTKLFLFGGGGEEAELMTEWAEKYPNTISLAGRRLGFPTELAVLSWLDVMVTMDSGNMHLASLVGTPVVSIWGATHPYCGFTGWNQSDENIVQLDLPCRPCSVFGDKPCVFSDYHCLSAIIPQQIIDKINRIVK